MEVTRMPSLKGTLDTISSLATPVWTSCSALGPWLRSWTISSNRPQGSCPELCTDCALPGSPGSRSMRLPLESLGSPASISAASEALQSTTYSPSLSPRRTHSAMPSPTSPAAHSSSWSWWPFTQQKAAAGTDAPQHEVRHRQQARTCAMCGKVIAGREPSLTNEPGDSVSSWLQLQQGAGSGAPVAATPHKGRLRRLLVKAGSVGGKVLRFAVWPAAATTAARVVLPAHIVRGHLPQVALLLVGWRAWRQQRQQRGKGIQHQGRSQATTKQLELSRPALQLLSLPHMAWLNEDIAQRLLVQYDGSVEGARQRAESIHAWREKMGMDRLTYPTATQSVPATASTPRSSLSFSSLSRRASQRQQQPHQPGCRDVQAQAGATYPAAQAVLHFEQVAKAAGCSLVHVDDAQGLGVVWIQGACLNRVKSQLCADGVMGPAAARPAAKGQDPPWVTACALHVCVMSEWVWRQRLPNQPVEAGRFVQVVDLKGMSLGAAMSDGLAVVKAIMSAGHHYPQRLVANIVLNPPPGLALIWHLVAQMLPKPVSDKIKIVRGGVVGIHQELQKWMPEALIPSQYGGRCGLPLEEYPTQLEVQEAMARTIRK